MKAARLIIWCITILVFIACSSHDENQHEVDLYDKNFIADKSYFDNQDLPNNAVNNKIYRPGRRFVFDLCYMRQGKGDCQNIKITQNFNDASQIMDFEFSPVSAITKASDVIDKVSLYVYNSKHQSATLHFDKIAFEYLNAQEESIVKFSELSKLLEDEDSIYIQTPLEGFFDRLKYFDFPSISYKKDSVLADVAFDKFIDHKPKGKKKINYSRRAEKLKDERVLDNTRWGALTCTVVKTESDNSFISKPLDSWHYFNWHGSRWP